MPSSGRTERPRPLVNTASSLLIAAVLTVVAFAVTRPVVDLEPDVTTAAVPAAFAVILIALFVMATRRHAVSQAAGFLMLDNGIAATAFLLTAGVPLIVELGASLDVLFAVIVIGVLTGRLRRTFGERRPGPVDGVARLMTVLLIVAILAPVLAAVATLIAGWRRPTAMLTVAAATTVLGCGAVLGLRVGGGAHFALGGLLRVDALTVTMLIVIGAGRHAGHLGRASATSTPNSSTATPTPTAPGCTAC